MNGLKVGDKVYMLERWPNDGVNGVVEFEVTKATPKQIKATHPDTYVHTFRICDLGNKVFLSPESALRYVRDKHQKAIDSRQKKINAINKHLEAWAAKTKGVASC